MKAETMWNNLANNWDTPGVSLGKNDIKIIEKTKKYLHASDIVLDYGCATGSIILEIADIVTEAHGIDLSSVMVDIARRKAGEHELSNMKFMQATIFDDRLQQESYDLILAFSILHLVENPTQVLQRIHQLLKPGGFFISATPCLGEKQVIGMLINLPVFLLSKVGILPHVNFFRVSGLSVSITNAHFQITENESLSAHLIADNLIVARKL